MPKPSCQISIVYSLFKKGQDFLDKQYTLMMVGSGSDPELPRRRYIWSSKEPATLGKLGWDVMAVAR